MPSRPLPPPDPDDPIDLLAAAVQSAVEGGALHGTSDAWQAGLRELALLDAALSFDCPGTDALVRMVRTGATMAACCVADPASGSEDQRALVAAVDGGSPEVLAEWLRWLIARATERLTAGQALAALALATLALRTPRESADPSLEAAALRVAAMAAEASGAESPARLWALCADAAPEPALRDYARARALPGFGALAAWGPL